MNETEFWSKLFSGAEVEAHILVRNDSNFDKLMAKLESLGYRWMEGQPPTRYNPWIETGEVGARSLCVTEYKRISCGSDTSQTDYSIKNAPLGPSIEVEIV